MLGEPLTVPDMRCVLTTSHPVNGRTADPRHHLVSNSKPLCNENLSEQRNSDTNLFQRN